MSDPNKLLGHWTCPEGGKAEVYQTKKRGRHFYTRCDCCGLQQGTGASRQQKIYNEAEFIPGVEYSLPSNVKADQKPTQEEKPAKAAVLPDFDPNEAKESEPEGEAVTEQASGNGRLMWALGLVGMGLAAGVGAWMN
ncbi:hypothetical protein [Teredinibacter turnerae]|uniref:hypothetical protein n=1 Tax=Teredinibacter turnerae TaxID=2426 RepID=UPI0005F89797|nr:hypothetical protein [Teredinibacter turnerae]